MVLGASNYVRSVIHMKAKALNYAGRSGEELRIATEQSDQERRNCHNALISYVDIVNRICGFHNLPPIYTGSSARREYGDFAIALTNELTLYDKNNMIKRALIEKFSMRARFLFNSVVLLPDIPYENKNKGVS